MNKRVINPWTWQDQFGFVQANEVSDGKHVLYCAGQTSIDADGNAVHAGDMSAQIMMALDNLETVLKASGYALSDVIRLNFYTTDVDGFIQHIGPAAGRLGKANCRYASTSSASRAWRSPSCSSRSKRRQSSDVTGEVLGAAFYVLCSWCWVPRSG